jgi:photosystem II stability/assembly factor-like uncharacterized protein
MSRSVIRPASAVALAVLLFIPASAAAASGASRLPAGFQAQSISWASAQRGWLMGSETCGQTTCATVLGTTDGGTTWNTLGSMNAPVTNEKANGVTEMRFADASNGWAAEPAFWATTDGGVTWQQQTPPGGGKQVLALAADSVVAYVVVSPCAFQHGCNQPAQLWKTIPGSGSWTQATLTLPPVIAFNTVLAVKGTVAYIAIPAGLDAGAGATLADTLDVTTDGQTWTARPEPCRPDQGETLTGVAPISGLKVALMCQGNFAGGSRKSVFRSTDAAATLQGAGIPPSLGNTLQLAASPNGTLVMSASSVPGDFIYRNGQGRTWTTSVDFSENEMLWNDIVMVNDQKGWVIFNPVNFFNGQGILYETTDGGLTWNPVS